MISFYTVGGFKKFAFYSDNPVCYEPTRELNPKKWRVKKEIKCQSQENTNRIKVL